MNVLNELCKIISRTKPTTEKEAIYHSEIAPLAYASKTQVELLERQHSIAMRALKEISWGHPNSAMATADEAISKIDECD